MNKPIDTDELLRLNRTLRMISECTQQLARAADADELLSAICRIAIDFGGYDFSWVGRAEQNEAKTVRVIASAGGGGDCRKVPRTWDDSETGRGPVGTAIRTRSPVIARHIATDPAMAPWREASLRQGFASAIALPLVIEEEVFGAWALYSAIPDAFDESEVALLTELTRDIVFGITALRERADHQRAEEALRQSEATLRSVFRAAPVGIGILKDRRIEYANKKWCDLMGCSETEVVGKSTRMLYANDEEYERIGHALYDSLQEKGIASVESRQRYGDTFRDVVLTVAPIHPDDLAAGIIGITHDITEQKRTARELEQYGKHLEEMVTARTFEMHAANEQLEAIFRTANVGIVMLRDRIVVRCNARLEEMLGYGAGELIGTSTHTWYTTESDYVNVGRDVDNTIWRGETYRSTQRYRRKDGSLFWARLTDRALDLSDRSKGLVAVIEDITAEREAAESLKSALEKAEAADRLKSAFLATMSHELRTPLNSIIGFTGILLQELAGPLNGEQRKQLRMVQNSSRHLLALINDVLDISKIEAGQMQVRSEPFDLRASITKVAEIIRPQAEKKGLSLTVTLAPEISEWQSDPRRVEQILLNLLNNAVKFTDRGSVTLTAKTVPEGLVVSVADTGIGIKPDDLTQLFQPFRQVDTGLTRQHEGTGLGLAICRRLAGLLGGEVHAASEWGNGSVFTLTLSMKGPGKP